MYSRHTNARSRMQRNLPAIAHAHRLGLRTSMPALPGRRPDLAARTLLYAAAAVEVA
jgi:hypothetical protein